MSKSGIGVGSASIVLVFAVLCLTIFSLITYVVAGNDKSLVDARVQLVTGYYSADALAEQILDDILTVDTLPASIRGIDIHTERDDESGFDRVFFLCPVSDIKALYVNLAITNDSYEILSWRMYSIDEWNFDTTINVWSGDPE